MWFTRICKVTLALPFLGFCAIAQPASAQIDIVNNLNSTTAASNSIGGPTWFANSFQTDGQDYFLTSAVLKLKSGGNGAVSVSLYSNSVSNTPGVSLVSMGTSAPLGTAYANVSFDPVTLQKLDGNTIYWVVAQSPTQTSWGWTHQTGFSGVGTVPSASAFAFTNDNATTWTSNPISNGPFQLQVTGVPTPEPGGIALLVSVGLSGGGFAFRRRK